MTVSPVNSRLYISDYMNRRIIQVKTMGPVRDLQENFDVVAGSGEECTPGERDLCGDGKPALTARFLHPKGWYSFLPTGKQIRCPLDDAPGIHSVANLSMKCLCCGCSLEWLEKRYFY